MSATRKPRSNAPLNLFCTHGHELGCKESARLVMLFLADGWTEFKRTGLTFRDPEGYHTSPNARNALATLNTIYLHAPFKYEYKLLVISDNCTELNMSWVNQESFPSIYYSNHSMPLNAETMFYRLKRKLDGEEIDYDHIEQPLTNEEYALILKK